MFKKITTTLVLAGTLFLAQAEKLPKFSLLNLNNQNVTSQSLLGKGPLIINFWATWCIPCMQEMTALKPMFEKYKSQGLQVVSVSIDDAKTAVKVPGLVAQKAFPYLILLDPNKDLYTKLGISNAPELLIIDKNGQIVYRHQGYTAGDEKTTEAKIQELLK